MTSGSAVPFSQLNEDYLPNGWKVIQTQLFVNAEGEDDIFVVIEK